MRAYTVPGELWRRMKEAMAKYLEYLHSVKNASPHTILAYRRDREQFLAYLSLRSLALPIP